MNISQINDKQFFYTTLILRCIMMALQSPSLQFEHSAEINGVLSSYKMTGVNPFDFSRLTKLKRQYFPTPLRLDFNNSTRIVYRKQIDGEPPWL